MGASRQRWVDLAWAAAFGLFAAWLAHSLAPMWPISGQGNGNTDFYTPARIFYYIALLVSTAVLGLMQGKTRGEQKQAPLKAFILVTMIGQLITGILGKATEDPSETFNAWVACSFILSGAMTPALQIAWSNSLSRTVDRHTKATTLCAVVFGALGLFLLAFSGLPNNLAYSFIPLTSLCLLAFPRRDLPEGAASTDKTGTLRKQLVAAPFALLIGITCALVGSHIFNGAAEFDVFLNRASIIAGIAIAAGVFVLLYHLTAARRTFDVTAIATIATLAIVLSVALQGLAVNASGALVGFAGRSLHAIVLASEYLIYMLGLVLPLAHTPGNGQPQWQRFALPLVNAGVAMGAIAGILVTADILTYTVLSLIFSACRGASGTPAPMWSPATPKTSGSPRSSRNTASPSASARSFGCGCRDTSSTTSPRNSASPATPSRRTWRTSTRRQGRPTAKGSSSLWSERRRAANAWGRLRCGRGGPRGPQGASGDPVSRKSALAGQKAVACDWSEGSKPQASLSPFCPYTV